MDELGAAPAAGGARWLKSFIRLLAVKNTKRKSRGCFKHDQMSMRFTLIYLLNILDPVGNWGHVSALP
jgi:hypothetical protein